MIQITDPHQKIFKGTVEAFLNQKNAPFFPVPLNIAHNILHLSFTGGYHPFTEGIKAYHQDANIEVEKTPMARFYKDFQPQNLLEAFFKAWVQERIEMGGFGENMPKEEGSHYLGPTSKRHLESEWNRLKSIYHSVQEGFDITQQSDTIRGYFLTHQDKTIAVMVGGNHRTGVLAALNAPYIPMELHPHRPKIVQLEEMDAWPLVKSKWMSKALAKAVFLSFFT